MDKTICILQNRFINNQIGGYEVQIYNICLALLHKGWKVYYICEGLKENQNKNFPFDVWYVKDRYYFSFYHPDVFSLLRSISPAIVYQRSRTVFSCGLLGKRYVNSFREKKFVFGLGSLDDLIPFYLTKSLWNDKHNSFTKKLSASPDTLIKDYLFQFNIKKADLLISQNIEQQGACKKQYGRESIIVRSIHPPVGKKIIKNSPPVICWIANARPVKQPELFMELIESLNDLSAKQAVHFMMVLGKNLHKYQETDMLYKLRQNPSVEIIGELTIEEANDVMEKSSLLVNTSTYEGFSNTFIQAWLRETPVVSLNSDPDDILKNYQIGFHSGNMEQVKKDVRFLIGHPDDLKMMGRRARAYAEEHHNLEKVADQLDELFTKLIRK